MDNSSFERFCAEAYPKLVAALAHHVGDRWVAEELAQEALVRAGDRWDRVRHMESPVGWTFRVGANLGTTHLRRRIAERRALARRAQPPTQYDDPTPDEGLRDALSHLREPQRRVLVLRYYLDLSVQQTADLLGCTPGAVKSLTHRALEQLRHSPVATHEG